MKILVIGGMHGNEVLGLEVVELLKRRPIDGVDVLLANERAIIAKQRFVGQDLNRSFPGDAKSVEYEPQRATQIMDMVGGYDVVLDFHNTHCPGNDCGFIGEDAETTLTDVAWLLGLDRLIVADYDCINKAVNNCLSVEISLDSRLNDSELWYEKIKSLARIEQFSTSPVIEKYRFVYRMTLEDKERLKLPEQNLKAFQPIADELAGALGVATPAYPIFVNDRFTPYNYGGVINKIG